ncbi:hypothetical protein DWG18_11570 [Lysobacter sp. TY2-98]|uniref:hypothetical protein n=1 Tax=Lysobacter sp. TY2-98 TaxID=2290922 RepID=UPI000E20AB2A|nr:hypothetical protein [Lysobacter sp. TY2-98]AXK72855.1 hypothetical protein DWG18_11570 [Lysobacter sp. TY2-98]
MALIGVALAAAFALQPLGVFHEGEATARDGENWLALQVTTGRSALVATEVRVRRVHDDVVDADGTDTGLEVTTTVRDATFLLRGPKLRIGPVDTAWAGVEPLRLPTKPLALKLHGASYRLQLDCAARGDVCRLVLAGGARTQVLQEFHAGRYDDGTLMLGDDASPALLFAGDLDHDGRLDLILDITDHYNASERTLFLSSGAAPRALVRRVALHRSTGC